MFVFYDMICSKCGNAYGKPLIPRTDDKGNNLCERCYYKLKRKL